MNGHRYRYGKLWRLDRARGLTRLVDAAPMRRHLVMLTGAGWTLRGIADHTGVSIGTLHRVAAGQVKVSRQLARAVLDFQGLDEFAQRGYVSRLGTVRRIQALLALGWPHYELQRRTGVRTDTILSRPGLWVLRETHDTIAALYAELATRPGPSNRSRLHAAAVGYLTPIHWDDIDHDAGPDIDPISTEPEEAS